jgi:hypothetical protein
MKVWIPKVSFLVTLPHAEMGLPSAPDKSGPEVAAETCVEKLIRRHLCRQEIVVWKPNPEER